MSVHAYVMTGELPRPSIRTLVRRCMHRAFGPLRFQAFLHTLLLINCVSASLTHVSLECFR